jgi:signal transduction histidine kinase/ligand-binding sensor domain-containing protein
MDPLSDVLLPLKPRTDLSGGLTSGGQGLSLLSQGLSSARHLIGGLSGSPPRYLPSLLIGTIVGSLLLTQPPASSAQRWHASGMGQPLPSAKHPFDDMAHMSWTRRDGAPSDINAFTQTTDGYLWIGSSRGLFRFDGLQFQSYPFTKADSRLPASDIAALAAAPDGGLWIGYRMGGITYLHDGQKIDYDGRHGLVSESTEQLVCRPDGSVWATADGRLMHLSGSRWENYSTKHGLSSEGLYTLFFDRDGNLWTADKGHVYELRRGEDKFALVNIPSGTVNQFVQLKDGTIWIVDAWKDVRPLHDDRRLDAVKIPGVPVMIADSENSIWLANDFGGLKRIKNPGKPERAVEDFTVANGLTDGQTRAAFQDRQGNIWIGTTRGLDRFKPSFLVQFRDVALDYYPALLADREDGIWLHDMDKPLMRYRSGHLSFVGQGHGSSSLFQDSDGSVWTLDQITRNFYRYHQDGGAPLQIPAPEEGKQVETWCMGKDPHNAFLACFEGHGLWRYDGKWERVRAPGLPQESPLSLVKGEGGRVWLGYAHNRIVLEDADAFHVYGQQDGLDLNTVFTFYDADGLVLSGGSDGLALFDGHRFHSLHLRSPELMRGVSGIVKDHFGDLWLNAGSGIVRIPQAEWQKAIKNPDYAMDFQLINEQDGLIGSPAQNKPAPSAVIDHSGLLWFATSGHLVSIDPATVPRGDSTPNLVLQSVIVNGQVYSQPQSAAITADAHGLKTLEFDYNGVDLNSPSRVVYQYMLEGQDKDWLDVGSRRQAFYTNLSPGKYRFRLRAATGSGPWSELKAPPALTVSPAFYQTTWFYLAALLLVSGLLWVIYRVRLQYLTYQLQERLEARVQERLRIARDLHDTLLQGVQGLILRFHVATEQLPAAEPVRATLRDALDLADIVIREGREKVSELRTEFAPATELAANLRRAANAFDNDGPPRIEIRVIGQTRPLKPLVNDELYWIGRESLTNAVRHAQATQIVVELTYDNRQLRLRCSDNGLGVDPLIVEAKYKAGHWGIIGMRERAKALGCKLDFSSQPGVGTEIQVCVDARRAYAKSDGGVRSFWFARLWSHLEPGPKISDSGEVPDQEVKAS